MKKKTKKKCSHQRRISIDNKNPGKAECLDCGGKWNNYEWDYPPDCFPTKQSGKKYRLKHTCVSDENGLGACGCSI